MSLKETWVDKQNNVDKIMAEDVNLIANGVIECEKDIEKIEKNKLESSELTNAINSALEQAKNSGDFKGDDGAPGKDGESITVSSVELISNGTKVTFSDGSYIEVMNGEDGKNGNGIKSAVLNADYTLTLTFDDGTKYTTPSIRGATGADGKSGTNGKDGTSVTVSNVSESTASGGTNTVTFSDGNKVNIKNGKDGNDYVLTEADMREIGNYVYAVRYVPQTLTDEQKAQARENIGAASADEVSELSKEIADEVTNRENAIEDLKAQGVQQTPLYAESLDWLNENGDTTKLYVLPDGYIYGYISVTEKVKNYTNLANTFEEGYRLNSSGVSVAADGATLVADYIPFKKGTIARIKGFGALTDYNTAAYNSSKTVLSVAKANANGTYIAYSYDSANEIVTLESVFTSNGYLRVSGILTGTTDDVIITVNEEIKEETATTQKWANTGHAFIPADYEERIVDLEENVLILQNTIETNNGGNSSETVTVPSYWETMVTEKTETVKALQKVGGKDCVCFAWASDTHIPDNDSGRTNDIGKVMAKMLDNCEIPFAVISGDINTRASYSAEETFVNAQASMPVHLAPLWGTDRLLMALGNHDGCYGDSTGYYRKQFTPERMWQIYFRGQALDFRRVFSDDGLYFYVDNISQKTRFIVLNSHFGGEYAEDENGWAVNNRFGTSCYGQAQLDWLADIALDMPEGYGALITAHVPPNVTYTVDKAQFIGIVNAYCNKTTYSGSFAGVDGWTSNSVSVDFTGAKGEIIAMFAGHVHGDSIDTTALACPLLTILSAGASANEPYKDDAPTRTAGTDTETSFDVVTINRASRTIYCTRVGAGNDREVSY